MDINQKDIDHINTTMASMDLVQRLQLAKDEFGPHLGMTSAFNYSGVILLYHLKDIMPELPIYFIDTRFHFKETYDFVETLKSQWQLQIQVLSTAKSEAEIETEIGPQAWAKDPDLCCDIRKVTPLMEVLERHGMWMSALRTDQAASRENLNFLERDGRGVLKLYPMKDWSRKQCWAFIRGNKLPYHPLHDKKFCSVGCTHCTTPIEDGQHERQGRWSSFPKMECGIHAHNR